MRKIKYIPSSISFGEGFNGPPSSVGYMMVFDYKKAIRVIKKQIKEGVKIEEVYVGLDGDWNINSDIIYGGDKFIEEDSLDFWCESVWATPILLIYLEDRSSERYEVWSKGKSS